MIGLFTPRERPFRHRTDPADAGCSIRAHSDSKAVSPPSGFADATNGAMAHRKSKAVSPPVSMVGAGSSIIANSKSKAVSPPALPADASYFLAPQEVTKKRCRATPPVLRLLAQPPARCPARFGRAGVRRTRYGRFAPVAQTCGGPFSGPPCNARRRRRRGAGSSRTEIYRDTHPTFGGHPSASMAPSIAAANGGFRFRMSERPKGASSEPAFRCQKRRGPGAVCRAPSRHERFCLLLPPQK